MSQYDVVDFNAAFRAVQDSLSVQAAAQQFNVPCQTQVKVMAEWRYPFTMFDLQIFLKAYLDKKGVVEPRFKNNMPTHR